MGTPRAQEYPIVIGVSGALLTLTAQIAGRLKHAPRGTRLVFERHRPEDVVRAMDAPRLALAGACLAAVAALCAWAYRRGARDLVGRREELRARIAAAREDVSYRNGSVPTPQYLLKHYEESLAGASDASHRTVALVAATLYGGSVAACLSSAPTTAVLCAWLLVFGASLAALLRFPEQGCAWPATLTVIATLTTAYAANVAPAVTPMLMAFACLCMARKRF